MPLVRVERFCGMLENPSKYEKVSGRRWSEGTRRPLHLDRFLTYWHLHYERDTS